MALRCRNGRHRPRPLRAGRRGLHAVRGAARTAVRDPRSGVSSPASPSGPGCSPSSRTSGSSARCSAGSRGSSLPSSSLVFAYLFYAVAVMLAMGAFGFAIGSGLVVALGIDWNWVAVLVGVVVGAALGLVSVFGNMPMVVLAVVSSVAGAFSVVGGLMLMVGALDSRRLLAGAPPSRRSTTAGAGPVVAGPRPDRHRRPDPGTSCSIASHHPRELVRREQLTRQGTSGSQNLPVCRRACSATAAGSTPWAKRPVAANASSLPAARSNSRSAPTWLPRAAWVRATQICASPCHRSRSSTGPAFHLASRTSCAANGRPASTSCRAGREDCLRGRQGLLGHRLDAFGTVGQRPAQLVTRPRLTRATIKVSVAFGTTRRTSLSRRDGATVLA